jgi:hypothetical protein
MKGALMLIDRRGKGEGGCDTIAEKYVFSFIKIKLAMHLHT